LVIALGPRELKLMERLGFLIDAYQVETWYWEVSEMLRKLIMTSLLVVVYDGSSSHLIGALIVTFTFILFHLQVHPYLNKGLNDFQRLALITQFLTIFGSIIFLMVGYQDDLDEVQRLSIQLIFHIFQGFGQSWRLFKSLVVWYCT
jgi:hypothetical protein